MGTLTAQAACSARTVDQCRGFKGAVAVNSKRANPQTHASSGPEKRNPSISKQRFPVRKSAVAMNGNSAKLPSSPEKRNPSMSKRNISPSSKNKTQFPFYWALYLNPLQFHQSEQYGSTQARCRWKYKVTAYWQY